MTFTSALIVERSSQGSRASVKEQGMREHVQYAPTHLTYKEFIMNKLNDDGYVTCLTQMLI